MQLPKNLLSGTYTKPNVFLCETDKTKICKLETINFTGTFKFNTYSEISLGVPRIYIDNITGETVVHPFYNKIEALRLIYVEGFGYFEIQDPKIESDGINETKTINAFSLEYTLSQKYLRNFVINNPDDEMNIGGGTPSSEEIDILVSLINDDDTDHSLLHLALQKAYGWTIGHVDAALKTQTRSFKIDSTSIYDFLVNNVAESYKCYFVFDTVENTVNVYADTSSSKFYGDGTTKTFTINPAYANLGSVTINGYKTLEYSYNNQTGTITFVEAPDAKALIEVEDGSLSAWDSDVFITFDNLATQMTVNYSADNIKTVLKVSGSDDMDIREVNMGLDYIMDLSYFHTPEWMGEALYNKYYEYIVALGTATTQYTGLLTDVQNLYDEYYELYNRVINPDDITNDNDNEDTVITPNLNDDKLDSFKAMLQYYYQNGTLSNGLYGGQDIATRIKSEFEFLGEDDNGNSIIDTYVDGLIPSAISSQQDKKNWIEANETATANILSKIWNEYGINLLQVKVDAYTGVQSVQIESGWGETGAVDGNSSVQYDQATYTHQVHYGYSNDNYYMYLANYTMLTSCQQALDARQASADAKMSAIKTQQLNMQTLANSIEMENYFNDEELIRLSAFLREDEYSDENFLITDDETNEEIVKSKKELLQCGKIELKNLCQPQFSFTATMANIYALDEFAPIIKQFQMGNLVRVALRPDYIRRTRLMETTINFEDFSDFSVTFGDLVSTKSQIDIHADLLNQAAQAGKTVASNSTYWDKGTDLATSTDTKLQQGLLDANTVIKSIDGNQGVEIDQYGIHLRKKNATGNGYDDKQAWMVNNMLCYTDDNWKTTRSALGEFTMDNKTYYGLLAEAVIAGYIEGSKMVGGTIKIGERDDGTYNFEVDEDGIVTFRAGQSDSQTQTTSTTISSISEHIRVGDPNNDTDGALYLLGENTSGSQFYVRLSSTELSFYEKSAGDQYDPTKVVWISGESMHARPTEIEESLKIVPVLHTDQTVKVRPSLSIGQYQFVIEKNNSLSIRIN